VHEQWINFARPTVSAAGRRHIFSREKILDTRSDRAAYTFESALAVDEDWGKKLTTVTRHAAAVACHEFARSPVTKKIVGPVTSLLAKQVCREHFPAHKKDKGSGVIEAVGPLGRRPLFLRVRLQPTAGRAFDQSFNRSGVRLCGSTSTSGSASLRARAITDSRCVT